MADAPRIALYRQVDDHHGKELLQQLAVAETYDLDPKNVDLLLRWDGGSLALKDLRRSNSRWLSVVPRQPLRRQAKRGLLAQAVGPRSKRVVDATAGWGGDSLLLYAMGYQVISIERHPVMAIMLREGFRHLDQHDLSAPEVMSGDARNLLKGITPAPDCVYIDPMFPPKRKTSALSKRALLLLRELVGDDPDVEELLQVSLATSPRVVVKRPDHAAPLARQPDNSFAGKLVRYDVYQSAPGRVWSK